MVNQQSNPSFYARLAYKQINIQAPINVATASSTYNYTTTSKVSNIGNRAIVEKINLHLDHKTTDYINYFRSFVSNDAMIKNGTVSYCFNQIDDELIYGANNVNRYSLKEDYHYAECIEKSWFSIERNIPNYLLTGWRNIDVKNNVEIEVSPGQTYTARMDVEIAKVNVPYNAIMYFQAIDYKGDYIVDSHVTDLATTIFGSNAVMGQIDQITAQIAVSGTIAHEVLQDVYININE